MQVLKNMYTVCIDDDQYIVNDLQQQFASTFAYM